MPRIGTSILVTVKAPQLAPRNTPRTEPAKISASVPPFAASGGRRGPGRGDGGARREAVAGRDRGGPRVCAETIYQAVYHGCLPVTARECLRTRRPRRRSRQVRHAHRRAGLPNINRRPAAVIDRTEPGHFELDRIYGVP